MKLSDIISTPKAIAVAARSAVTSLLSASSAQTVRRAKDGGNFEEIVARRFNLDSLEGELFAMRIAFTERGSDGSSASLRELWSTLETATRAMLQDMGVTSNASSIDACGISIVASSTNPVDLPQIGSESLSSAWNEILKLSDKSLTNFRICIGLTHIDTPCVDIRIPLMQAEVAQRFAAQVGGDCYRVYSANGVNDDVFYNHLRETARLHRRIACGQFSLARQEVVSLRDPNARGSCEVFLREKLDNDGRWTKDTIDLAKGHGLITLVDSWVLESAFVQMQHGMLSAHRLVAVNVSPQSLLSDGFVKSLKRIAESGMGSAERLCLEVSEFCLGGHDQKIVSRMQQVQQLGFQIGIDDFAGGRFSTRCLDELSINYVKVDSRLLEDTEDEESVTIAEALGELAHSYGASAIGKFVEDEQRLSMLRTLGFDMAQGYFLHRPVTIPAPASYLGVAQ